MKWLVVLFEMIYFDIYKYLGTEWKQGMSINDIVPFSEKFVHLSTAMVEMTNIDDSSHKDGVAIL